MAHFNSLFAMDGTCFQTFVRNKFSLGEMPKENDLPSEPMILILCESSLTFFRIQEKMRKSSV
ncbi:hypothetical protein EHQ55_15230 [Leptospira meyeri]|nr:hypothetical protein LEP1GSC017_2455 [Leptospira meyeri serovar Hardjo str. Went 5]EMJ89710.1 hypothetical protein LEP1GSC196_0896 [Leptospira meyeri serovar Semaranga str. Veldrot Semarang 173]TGL46001.1 hypothetical protein EHQ55_15230 [Leptospira meyeri]TGM24072.1 hypothetical protein EHQ73_03270 [Leptospira meyeri]TGM64726.1 hypothetical protein EHQ94_19370 [Leptospira meyeri]